jgi:hypothetical protein
MLLDSNHGIYRLACCIIENSEGKAGALCLRGKPLVDEIGYFVGRGNGGVP